MISTKLSDYNIFHIIFNSCIVYCVMKYVSIGGLMIENKNRIKNNYGHKKYNIIDNYMDVRYNLTKSV